jgi:hypothetical protein
MTEQQPRARAFAYGGLWLAFGLLLLTLALLWTMGRVPFCACGIIRLWTGSAAGNETSQQLLDWYSLSHVIHGLLFYGAAWLLFPKWPVGCRLAAAMAVEGAWEIFENTSFIIERYRAQTVSLDYYGDSIFNSFGDLAAMTFGFLLSARSPVWVSVLLAIAMEIVAAYVIRDNLSLNIIMLLWPLNAVKQWQMGV